MPSRLNSDPNRNCRAGSGSVMAFSTPSYSATSLWVSLLTQILASQATSHRRESYLIVRMMNARSSQMISTTLAASFDRITQWPSTFQVWFSPALWSTFVFKITILPSTCVLACFSAIVASFSPSFSSCSTGILTEARSALETIWTTLTITTATRTNLDWWSNSGFTFSSSSWSRPASLSV